MLTAKHLIRQADAAGAGRTLPALLARSAPLRDKARAVCAEANALGRFRQLTRTPAALNEWVFALACAGHHERLHELVVGTARAQLSPTFYLLLLRSIAMQQLLVKAALALQLAHELCAKWELSPLELALAADAVFDAMACCDDVTQIIALRAWCESRLTKDSMKRYYTAYCHVLANAGQFYKLDAALDKVEMDHVLFEKMFEAACRAQDCDTLVHMAHKYPLFFNEHRWLQSLSLGLACNHYKLVKFVYTHIVMANVGRITPEDVLFHGLEELNRNKVFASVTQDTLRAILHTLASHGDVNTALDLVELHYVHKDLRGERALTKELCLELFSAYSHSDATDIVALLSVLQGFTESFEFSYRDISEPLSIKLLSHTDPSKETTHNDNLRLSSQGNPLKDTTTLKEVLAALLEAAAHQDISKQVLQVFVSGVLNHLTKYQSATSCVHALEVIHNHDPSLWLTRELVDILFQSISTSVCAKRLGLELFKYLQPRGLLIDDNYISLIATSYRGNANNQLAQFLSYAYLKTPHTKRLTFGDEKIVAFAKTKPSNASVDRFWKQNALCFEEPAFQNPDKIEYEVVDERDANKLRTILRS